MTNQMPDLLTGTELCLVAEVPKGGARWKQVHLNVDVVRQFFALEPGSNRSLTLERISAQGYVLERTSRQLVYSEVNKNYKIEFSFGTVIDYPSNNAPPILVVVEAGNMTYRYRTLMPDESGYERVAKLLRAGPSVGKGKRRRIVTLDDLETYWPNAALRGGF